ncbi:MAG TPA: UDP-2,3-diacylglucosamine diphosphatase [Burkholderiaceae bacterium]|nr:UDP-2,3-diacylglucosamine diphosphatase [Burkholderiaceae bacterium]
MSDLSLRPPATTDSAQPEMVALFVSDLHLQPSLPRTTQVFFDFLKKHARQARRLYLLGDLFESWVGDDDIATPFNQEIVDAIRDVANAGVAVFWMAGNRDFLVGPEFAAAAGLTLLPDPFVAEFSDLVDAPGPCRIILTHGDAQCTDDIGYMQFRAEVRQSAWRQAFLALPLAQRKTIVAGMRGGSRAAQRLKAANIMDVNAGAITQLFAASGAHVMIHGHTHRPALHEYASDTGVRRRYVLPDWDGDTTPTRGGWIGLDAHGALHRFEITGDVLD